MELFALKINFRQARGLGDLSSPLLFPGILRFGHKNKFGAGVPYCKLNDALINN